MEAAKEAAEGAISSVGRPDLTFLFTVDSYDQEEVYKTVKKVAGDSRIIGMCGRDVITPEGSARKGVGVAALAGGGIKSKTVIEKVADNPFETGQKVGRELTSNGIVNGTVIVFVTPFTVGEVSRLMQGIYDKMGPSFNFIGGGGEYIFTEEDAGEGGVAATVVEGMEIRTGISHGWRPFEEPLVITRAEDKKIIEIDGNPALEEYIGQLEGISADEFSEHHYSYPLGIPDIYGNYLIREVLSVDEDGNLNTFTDIPEGSVVNVMEGKKADLIKSTKRSIQKIIAEGRRAEFVLVCDCLSRFDLLGERGEEELQIVKEVVGGDVPLFGTLTAGEIGSFTDAPMFHNKTLAMGIGFCTGGGSAEGQ